MKQIFDYILSIVALLTLLALLIFIAICIKLNSRGPIFYTQGRVGKDGKVFRIIKFRTMIHMHDNDNSITVKGDKRVTGLGVFLRKYKIDELPELFNVIKGDMSFVGPRPDVPGYVDRLTGEDRLILNLKPGITGPASLKYSNEEELLANESFPKDYNDDIIFPDKVRMNLEYYYNNNIWLDIKIIFATIFKIIS